MTASHRRRLSSLGLRGHAREEFPFRPDLSVFKVGGKMFALGALSEDPAPRERQVRSQSSASSFAPPTRRSCRVTT